MSIGIYLDATTGGTDGTLEVPGDGVGATLGAVGSTDTFHLRAASGYESGEAVTVTAPAGCQVSKDDLTYADSVEYAAGDIGGTNVVCYIKRTSGTTASVTGLVTTPRLALITEADAAAPTLGGTLAATPGDTQVTLVGATATDNVGIAKWQYSVDGGAYVDIADSANGTMPSTVVGSLTNDTEYSFTVRALDAAGNASTASGAVTATPTSADWFISGRGTLIGDYDFESGDEGFTFGTNTARAEGGAIGGSYGIAITQSTADTFAAGPTFANQDGTLWLEYYTVPVSSDANTRCGVASLFESTTLRWTMLPISGNWSLSGNTLAAFTAGKTYRIRAKLSIATDKTLKVGITNITDAGEEVLYDNGGNGYAFQTSASVINSFRIGQYSPSGSGVSKFDDVKVWA